MSSNNTYHCVAFYPSELAVYQQGINRAIMKRLKLVLLKSYYTVSEILLFHSLWTNVLIVSRFGQKCLLKYPECECKDNVFL